MESRRNPTVEVYSLLPMGRCTGAFFSLLVVIQTAAIAAAAKFSIVIDAGSTGCRLYVYQTDPGKHPSTGIFVAA